MSLVNDVLVVTVEERNPRALIRLDNRMELSREARDFQVGSLYRAFSCVWDSGAAAGARVLFTHEAPASLDEYVATFDGRPIEFGAPLSGFELDAAWLDAPLATAEPRLHALLVDQADRMLALPRHADDVRGRVQRAIASELSEGDPSICRIAEKLHMSPRTLERRLEREGTTFSAVQDALRRDLALRYVENASLELTEVAFLLGFSQTTGFHRAFKRWTGQTPLEHRRARGGA
jgi:AraC-like DNA-binding protein